MKELETDLCSTWDELVIYGSICFDLTEGASAIILGEGNGARR